jgi:hypothetical protein
VVGETVFAVTVTVGESMVTVGVREITVAVGESMVTVGVREITVAFGFVVVVGFGGVAVRVAVVGHGRSLAVNSGMVGVIKEIDQVLCLWSWEDGRWRLVRDLADCGNRWAWSEAEEWVYGGPGRAITAWSWDFGVRLARLTLPDAASGLTPIADEMAAAAGQYWWRILDGGERMFRDTAGRAKLAVGGPDSLRPGPIRVADLRPYDRAVLTGATSCPNGLRVERLACVVASVSADGSVKVWPEDDRDPQAAGAGGKLWFEAGGIEAAELVERDR